MIHTGVLRETENASVGPNLHKLPASEQKVPRLKSKALGDVQNTLHSRLGNFANTNAGSGIKAPNKSSIFSKPGASEKVLPGKPTASGRVMNVTPTKSAISNQKNFISTPTFDNEMLEIHNHILCEQDHQFYLNDFLEEYKFSEEQINRLAQSVKSYVTPYTVETFEPCEDIDIPEVKNFNENSFSVNDIFCDMISPPVPAPIEMF